VLSAVRPTSEWYLACTVVGAIDRRIRDCYRPLNCTYLQKRDETGRCIDAVLSGRIIFLHRVLKRDFRVKKFGTIKEVLLSFF